MPLRDTFTNTVEDAAQYEREMADLLREDPDFDPAAEAEADADSFEYEMQCIGYDAYVAQYGEPHVLNPSHPF